MDLYESVKVKSENITGIIVAIDTDNGTKPPIYFVEKDDIYKTGESDLEWYESHELEIIKRD